MNELYRGGLTGTGVIHRAPGCPQIRAGVVTAADRRPSVAAVSTDEQRPAADPLGRVRGWELGPGAVRALAVVAVVVAWRPPC